jgi:hypothetical protein
MILWHGEVLFWSVWYPGGFLYLDVHFFLKIWSTFCYYFVEYIDYIFGLIFFSFFNAHDSALVFWWSCRVLSYSFSVLESFV